jgi:hypothetical protein
VEIEAVDDELDFYSSVCFPVKPLAVPDLFAAPDSTAVVFAVLESTAVLVLLE